VAATGKSYLCEDTAHDPLYLEGVKGAKSSLTVPLKLHNEVIGTFNVESPQPHAFTDSDLQFLKVFCRDVAVSLNTLQLLVAQQMTASQESVALIHRQVALPIDEIVSDATCIDEQSTNLDPETRARLKKILDHARGIKDVIQKVGRTLPPLDIGPATPDNKREKLKGKRVLVVDSLPEVRKQAHDILERHDCVVETVYGGAEAASLFRHNLLSDKYHVVIAGVQLSDMSAYDLLMRLKSMATKVPMILTQTNDIQYDSEHTLVKCRREGLHPAGWIVKPFKERQLLDTLETILDSSDGARA
jgi:CheY-like chemotaxis protein